jgi:serine/threonine protein phosphatase PrpC
MLPEIDANGLSITGPVREDNQDAILPELSLSETAGSLHAVADGMGGYAHGEVASNLALEALTSTLNDSPKAAPDKALRRGLETANLNVYKASQTMGVGRMGTTLTAAYIIGDTLHIAHIGDSRAYLIRNGKSTCLTNDHTVVGDMVRSKLISPDKVRTHVQRSILTRAIGLGMFIQPDLTRVKIQPDDYIILCSDGIWSVIDDDEFALYADHTDSPYKISQNLIDLALERETDDNCSAVTVHIQDIKTQVVHEEARSRRSWFGFLHR